MATKKKKSKRVGVPEYKKKLVADLAEKIKKSKTVLVASTKGLPSSQFQEIKKKLRGKAEVKMMRKSAITRAIDSLEKGALQNLKAQIGADTALFFSDMDAFDLSGLLSESQSPTKAKAGDVVPEDVKVEPGPTDLPPGPAISELSGVGLKVAVEEGKLAIKKGAVIVKAGEEVKENVASVMAKLNIMPMKVGFIPLAAYDSESDKVYVGINIDKEETLEELRSLIGKAMSIAINVGFTNKETIVYLLGKAGMEEKALAALVKEAPAEKPAEEKKEEPKAEEAKPEEKAEEKPAEEKAEEKVEEKKEESNDKDTKEEAK